MLGVLYSVGSYGLFVLSLLYLVGFVGGFAVPKGVDDGAVAGLPVSLLTNLALLALFGSQHSVMARAGFKRLWTRVVPPALERSTYVLCSSAALVLLMVGGHPLPALVWQVDNAGLRAALWGLCAVGWGLALMSTFLIDHFGLFGLRQAWTAYRGRGAPDPGFATPGPYRLVRHPLYLGFLVAFWATPCMSWGHLLLAAGFTAYILIGVSFEERDLARLFGQAYRDYQRRVPMLLPGRRPPRDAPRQ